MTIETDQVTADDRAMYAKLIAARLKELVAETKKGATSSVLVMAQVVYANIDHVIAALEVVRDQTLDPAVSDVIKNANDNAYKRPTMLTLIEEWAESVLSARDKHDDPLRLELVQIAGVCVNLIRRIDAGDVISLTESEAQFFYVSGQVKVPGEKVFRRGLTLTQAIIAAGGLSKDGKEAQVARDNGKGFLMVTRYKLKEIDTGKVPDPPINPGDRITISD